MYRVIFNGRELSIVDGNAIETALGGELKKHSTRQEMRLETLPSQKAMLEICENYRIDVNVLPKNFEPENIKLVVSDMDSTLISIECIDEIADFADVKSEVSAITESAMRGELDFKESLLARVNLLGGLDELALQRVYDERLTLNPGAELMIQGLKSRGIKFALVSGGFTFFTDRLKDRLALDYSLSNTLEIINGKLTGQVTGKIVGAEAKAEFLLQKCRELNISPGQVLAIGDGANDLKMMAVAGLGVAYHAKPKVQEEADCAINHAGLEGLLALL